MEYTETRPCGAAAVPSPDGALVAAVCGVRAVLYNASNGAVHAECALPAGTAHSWRAAEVLWSWDSVLVAFACPTTRRIAVLSKEGTLHAVLCENGRLGWDRLFWMRRACRGGMRLAVVLRHRMGVRVWAVGQRRPLATLPCGLARNVRESADGRFVLCLYRCPGDQQHKVAVWDVHSDGDGRPRLAAVCVPPEQAVLDDACFAALAEGSALPALYAWEGAAFGGRAFYFTSAGRSGVYGCRVVSCGVSGALDGVDATSGVERFAAWTACGTVGAVVHSPSSFALWNGALLRMSPSIVLGVSAAVVYRERSAGRYEAVSQSHAALGEGVARTPLSLSFSCDGRWLAVHGGDALGLWIYRTDDVFGGVPAAAVVIVPMGGAIRAVSWHDALPSVAFACDRSEDVHVWHPNGPPACHTARMDVRAVAWASGRDALVVSSADAFCLGTPSWVSV